MTALDPGDYAYADEQVHAYEPSTGPDAPEVVEGEVELVPPRDGQMLDGSQPPSCSHPPSARRLIDGEQVCLDCSEVVEGPTQTIIPKDRPGGVDPTQREGDRSAGGLKHVDYDPAQVGGPRPYTPDQIEREIVDTLDRIERGAGWLTTQEEKRGAAKLQYELAFARARFASNGRSSEQRNDEAMLECRELYSEWQLLELTCRTAREGMHNLRSKLSGLQSVARSIGVALGSYR